MTFEVLTSYHADRDVEDVALWLYRNISPAAAARWQDRIQASIDSLAVHPERCPEADEVASLNLDLRVLLSGRCPHVYRILFRIVGQSVLVYRVLHAARDSVKFGDL